MGCCVSVDFSKGSSQILPTAYQALAEKVDTYILSRIYGEVLKIREQSL